MNADTRIAAAAPKVATTDPFEVGAWAYLKQRITEAEEKPLRDMLREIKALRALTGLTKGQAVNRLSNILLKHMPDLYHDASGLLTELKRVRGDEPA